MLYNKKNSNIKRIIKMGGVLTHSISGEAFTPNELLGIKENNTIINKSGFNKIFKKFASEMDYDIKDYGYCIMWSNYGLDKENCLNGKYLEKLKKEMSSAGVVKLLQRLIKAKMIARTGRGKYTLNPNIAQYGVALDKSIYDLFN